MDGELVDELLERLGYTCARKEAMRLYLDEFARRKAVLEGCGIDTGDIVSATMIFDGFNRVRKVK